MKFDKEFKEAISHLPSKEKDKLILRLLKKDIALANRLYFELIDDKTVDDRRQIVEENIIKRARSISNDFYSPGYLMMDMRFLSGDITEHVKITKDKFGEPYLNLLMLINVLEYGGKKIEAQSLRRAEKLCVYIIARTFKIMVLINKLHPDLWMEFDELLGKLGWLIGNNDLLMKMAIHHGLDVNWLIKGEIPEDIEYIQKDLRQRGYLK